MQYKQVELAKGSDIKYELRLATRDGRPFFRILHIKFSGNYRTGSEGTPDASLIHGVIQIGKSVYRPSSLVLDYGDLSYEWGDNAEEILASPDDPERAVILGPGCEPAMRSFLPAPNGTIIDSVSNYFWHIDEAMKYVMSNLVLKWNEDSKYRAQPELLNLEHELDRLDLSQQNGSQDPLPDARES